MSETRRTMLAALGAAILAPGCKRARWTPPESDPTSRALVKPYVPGVEAYATHEERWVTSTCGQCPAGCGIRVRVVEGRAVRVEGNPQHPINSGGLGVRGLSGLQTLYDPDRIPQPLRRVGDRLVPVPWSDALSTLATALAATRATPERLLVMSGAEHGFVHELLARFATAFGTPNFVDGSPSHSATLARAMELATGRRDLPAYRWETANAILSLEAGLFEDSCRSTYFAHAVAAMRRDRRQRARLYHAGPVLDLAAYNADRWLRIQPGTSGALALGICHALRDHITDPAFKALAAEYTPERVATITGCDADAIALLARDLWDRRPALVIVDERSLAFTNGLATAQVALGLSTLLESPPIGGASPPLAEWPHPPIDDTARLGLAMPRLDGAGHAPYAGATSVLDALPQAILATPPAVALLHRTNPLYARARAKAWREALAAIPLVVSFSPFLDETTAASDLVLPDHTYLERFEDALPHPSSSRATVGVRKPAVAPLHDTRATADVLIDLAQRVGLGAALPWRIARDAFDARFAGLHASARGSIIEPTQRAFLERFYRDGFWTDDREAETRRLDIALPSSWCEPQWDGAPTEFPLVLVPYHPLGHADGSGANQPWLRMLRTRPGLGAWSCAATISPLDAPAGARRIRVTSPHGSLVVPVHLDDRIARGCVAIPMGAGHETSGRWARFGVNVMKLVGAHPQPDTGASPWCTTRVRVEAA